MTDEDDGRKRQTIHYLNATIAHLSGRRYTIRLEQLDHRSLLELQRLLRDLESEKTLAVHHARRLPWQG
jgi:hypothetical protein